MLLDNGFWGKTQYLLEKSLDTETVRRKVIADNLANVDVPHFKRSEVSFEAELRRVLQSEKEVEENNVPAKMTDMRHIPFYRERDYHAVAMRTHIDYLSTMRNDGNNVDPEHEMTEALKNQMRYQALTTMMSSNFRTMNIVMRPA